jgi:hypothetical protein
MNIDFVNAGSGDTKDNGLKLAQNIVKVNFR